jgi:hypothetical protein
MQLALLAVISLAGVRCTSSDGIGLVVLPPLQLQSDLAIFRVVISRGKGDAAHFRQENVTQIISRKDDLHQMPMVQPPCFRKSHADEMLQLGDMWLLGREPRRRCEMAIIGHPQA